MLTAARPLLDQGRRDARRARQAHARRNAAAVATVVAATLCAGPWPLEATATRTADQRFLSAPTAPVSSNLGATVAMSRSREEAFGLAGAPGDGEIHHFRHTGGAAWSHRTHAYPPTGLPQHLALDIGGNGDGWVAERQSDGSTSLWRYDHVGWIYELEGFPSVVKAVAYQEGQEGFLALGLPDWDGERGLITIYDYTGVGSGWQYAGAFLGEPGDRLGSALAANDVVLVAGAPGYGANGAAFIYARGSEWFELQRLDSPALDQAGAAFGAAVDVEAGSLWIAVGSPNADRIIFNGVAVDVGAVDLYEPSGFGWQLAGRRRPPGASDYDWFGTSVALHDGLLVAGSPGEDVGGAAYVYQRSGSQWPALPHLRLVDAAAASGDYLGASVAVGDLGALVGAPYADANGVTNQGAVLFYSGIATLFADGFESGDASAWSAATP